MLRALSSLALETIKDGDCTAPPSNLSYYLDLPVGQRFEAFPHILSASHLLLLKHMAFSVPGAEGGRQNAAFL